MEILIIAGLTLLNSFFSLSEIALVSVKRSRIQTLADKGNSSAKVILQLLDDPETFLSSVQVGITLIGIIAGAYGGAALTDDMVAFLSRWPVLGEHVHTIALALVISGITYFTIVIGELVPKSIALNSPERVALIAAPIIRAFSIVTMPVVKLLSVSTTLILKLLRIKDGPGDQMSEEELRSMIRTANLQGVLEEQESQAHHNLFRFTDHVAKTLMTQRSELEWVDSEASMEEIIAQVKESVHSKFPVGRGSIDEVWGIITLRDLLAAYDDPEFHLSAVVRKPIMIPLNTPAFTILNRFRKTKQYAALVIDEHGQLRGMVTLHDLTEAIVGDLPDDDEDDSPDLVEREDGSWLLNGQLLIGDLNQTLERQLIEEQNSSYTTVAGFVLNKLSRMPVTGDIVREVEFHLDVVNMDGRRIDKLILTLGDGGE